MSKPMTRLYPADVEQLPREPLGGSAGGGSHARVLARDPVSGSQTRLVGILPRVILPPAAPDAWVELLVLGGEAELDGRTYGEGSYLCLPPGTRDGAITGAGAAGFEALVLEDVHPGGMDKPHVRLTGAEAEALEPEPAVAGVGGIQRTLAAGPSGSHTRLLDVEAGDDCGVLVHDFFEEGIILSGSYTMTWELGEEHHPAGTYTHLPPHVPHGPIVTTEGYRCFEVRNYG